MTPQAVAAGQWTERRRRAADLRGRWPFAREVLTFYSALLDAQERVYDAARSELSDPSRTIAYTVARALPLVSEVTASRGPERLARAVADLAAAEGNGSTAPWAAKVQRWLDGGVLSAVDRYLARAAAGPVLEALGPVSEQVCGGPRDPRHCPRCGGLPQVSILTPSGEALVAPRRFLECSHQRAVGHCAQVHLLLRSAAEWLDAGLCQGLPDPGDSVRTAE